MRKDIRDFARWLDLTMENQNITNRELSNKINVNESMTSRWRSARSVPNMENCEKLAEALGVDFLSLAVTARILDGNKIGIKPLDTPEPTVIRSRIRFQLRQIQGLTEGSIEAALHQWDTDVAEGTAHNEAAS